MKAINKTPATGKISHGKYINNTIKANNSMRVLYTDNRGQQ